VPKEIAKEAIKANPEKSNRTIAKETGTSLDTVNRARNELGERGRSPERIGQDGKTYRVDAAERAEARCQAQWKAFAAEEVHCGVCGVGSSS
jgi:transposase